MPRRLDLFEGLIFEGSGSVFCFVWRLIFLYIDFFGSGEGFDFGFEGLTKDFGKVKSSQAKMIKSDLGEIGKPQ